MRVLLLAFVLIINVNLAGAQIADSSGQTDVATHQDPAARSQAISDFIEQSKRSHTTAAGAPGAVGIAPTISSSPVSSMLQGLVLCVGLFFIGLSVYKRIFVKEETVQRQRIRILERAQINSKVQLVLAQVDGRKVLLGISGDQITPVPFSAPLSDLREQRQSQNEMIELKCEEEIKLSA